MLDQFNLRLNYKMAEVLANSFQNLSDQNRFATIKTNKFDPMASEDSGTRMFLPKMFNPARNFGLCFHTYYNRIVVLTYFVPSTNYVLDGESEVYDFREIVDHFTSQFTMINIENSKNFMINFGSYMKHDPELKHLFRFDGGATNYVTKDHRCGCIIEQDKIDWIDEHLWQDLHNNLNRVGVYSKTMNQLRSEILSDSIIGIT